MAESDEQDRMDDRDSVDRDADDRESDDHPPDDRDVEDEVDDVGDPGDDDAHDRASTDGDPDDAAPEVNQPGLGALREAVRTLQRRLPGQSTRRQDALAGLNVAVANVPDGLANGLLVGVIPVFGLYATMVGPLVGGIVSSTRLMIITTTAAASLTAGQALSGLPAGERETALFLMVVLVGVFQVAFGLLKMGRLTRFVSYSVTTGFLTGIAVLLILSQLPTVTGIEVTGANRVSQTINLLANAERVEVWSLVLAVLALALGVLLPKTRMGNAGRLLAVVVPSIVLAIFGFGGVEVVSDVGEIPRSIPLPSLPSLTAAFDVLTCALSVAVVILVQGAGVSQSVPNPDGSRSRASRDFLAQGTANLVSGLFRGLPVGGSMSATAINVVSGAGSRWAAIFAGLGMAVLVVGFPGAVSYVAMPALGALLIIAGVSSVKPDEVASVWDAGWPSRLAGISTFVATLFLPIQAAVGLGVVLSAFLYLNESSTDVSVVRLVKRDDGRIEEDRAPERLESAEVTVLDVYGHLFYAGPRTLERLLPSPRGAERPVVVLRLRGRGLLGATLIDVLSHYSEGLHRVGGRLYLTGMSERACKQVEASGKMRLSGPVRTFEGTPIVGESTHEAVEHARVWLVGEEDDDA